MLSNQPMITELTSGRTRIWMQDMASLYLLSPYPGRCGCPYPVSVVQDRWVFPCSLYLQEQERQAGSLGVSFQKANILARSKSETCSLKLSGNQLAICQAEQKDTVRESWGGMRIKMTWAAGWRTIEDELFHILFKKFHYYVFCQ